MQMHAFLVGKNSIQIATYEGKQSKVAIHSFQAHFNAKARPQPQQPMLLIPSSAHLHVWLHKDASCKWGVQLVTNARF